MAQCVGRANDNHDNELMENDVVVLEICTLQEKQTKKIIEKANIESSFEFISKEREREREAVNCMCFTLIGFDFGFVSIVASALVVCVVAFCAFSIRNDSYRSIPSSVNFCH